jgi:hypothetical protein
MTDILTVAFKIRGFEALSVVIRESSVVRALWGSMTRFSPMPEKKQGLEILWCAFKS